MIKYKPIILLITVLFLNIFGQSDRFESSRMFFYNKEIGGFIKNDSTIAVTDNGGQNWQETLFNTNTRLRSVVFTSKLNGWLNSANTLYKTTDIGVSWLENFSTNKFRINSVYFINENVGVIGGQGKDSLAGPVIYFTNDAGSNWEEAIIDSLFNDAVLDFSFANDTVGIAVGFFTIYRTTNAGSTWHKLPPNFYMGAYTPTSAQMLNESEIILITEFPYVVINGYLFVSEDSGLSWNSYGNGRTFKWGIRDSYILNQDSIWLTTGSATYFTESGGNYWDTLNVKTNYFSFISNDEAYGLNERYVLYTNDGWQTYSIVDSLITSNRSENVIENSLSLSQNYPNPFNPSTTIKFNIPVETRRGVSLRVYDILGREVKTLINKNLSPGNYEVTFDGSNLASGVYFYVLETGVKRLSKKMLLVK